jgi:hypothetical protein
VIVYSGMRGAQIHGDRLGPGTKASSILPIAL